MRISVLMLTVLLIVAVAAVGAKNIFRQSEAANSDITVEQNRALQDALKNGMLSETDFQSVSKRVVLLRQPNDLRQKTNGDPANPSQP